MRATKDFGPAQCWRFLRTTIRLLLAGTHRDTPAPKARAEWLSVLEFTLEPHPSMSEQVPDDRDHRDQQHRYDGAAERWYQPPTLISLSPALVTTGMSFWISTKPISIRMRRS